MSKPYVHFVDVSIYNSKVFFFIDREKGIKFAKKVGFPIQEQIWRDPSVSGVCSADFNQRALFIGIFNTRRGTVAHEIGHASVLILGHSGIPVEPDNHEALTYLLGWLTDEYYSAMERPRTRKV